MPKNSLYFQLWKLYFLLIVFIGLISFAISYLFLSDGIFYQSFGEKLATERIAKMIESFHKSQWLGYVFISVIVLIRVSFTATCLYSGYFIANLKVRFRDLFKVALLADFVFVLGGLTKLVILIFFKQVSILDDLQFQPFSIMGLFNKDSIDPLFVYPLSLISVFELFYWLVLAWLLTRVIEQPFGSSLKIVASSYGIGMLLWILFIMFLTVNLS
jgi:hypothetical protein